MNLIEFHLHLVALFGMDVYRAEWRGLGEAVCAVAKGGSQAWGPSKGFSPWVIGTATTLGAVRTQWHFEMAWWLGEPMDCRWSCSLHDTTCQGAEQHQEVSELQATHPGLSPFTLAWHWGFCCMAEEQQALLPRDRACPSGQCWCVEPHCMAPGSSTTSLYQS